MAAAQWETVIDDEFDDLPAGTQFEIRNPTTDRIETVTLSQAVDDLIVFVGARNLAGATLALAGPDGTDAAGDVYDARISDDFRGTGAVTDFEPWAGTITFDTSADWSFSLGNPGRYESDFVSVAVHEIGHILGVGTSGAFDQWLSGSSFTGPNARAENDGRPIPTTSDGGHVRNGFADDAVSLDPSLTDGTRVLVSDVDKAILADIGYEITGFSKQGTTPPIVTDRGELVFGRDVNDTINGLVGDDTLQGDGGDDRLLGGAGNDILFGQSGNDILIGGNGDDYLAGGSGNDILRGGAGNDTLFGESGQDVFEIAKNDDRITISDFDVATETIRLIDSGFDTTAAAAASVTKAAENVSRVTLSDGTTVDVFHDFQSGSPLTATNFELIEGKHSGTSGNDSLVVSEDVERIEGGDGVDTAVFGGDQSDFTISFSANGVTVANRADGGEVVLDSVELIDFSTEIPALDGAMALDEFGGHTGLDSEALEFFIEMYIAYFNRAPDALGLAYWGTQYADGMSLEEIADYFADQEETIEVYPEGTNNIKFTYDVYQNVLGRSPDSEGLQFWTKALDDGHVTRGEFILEVLRGVDAEAPAGASQAFLDRQAADKLYLEQKTDLGAFFSVHKGMSNVDNATQALALFDGSAQSLSDAVEAIEIMHSAAMDAVNGEFLMPLVGVLDDPFAV
nr:DUF4214 domain-containing protein [Marivita sp. GX14005]